jgi:hypothetical protein
MAGKDDWLEARDARRAQGWSMPARHGGSRGADTQCAHCGQPFRSGQGYVGGEVNFCDPCLSSRAR